jgi:tRNA (mo5U34)-methyltransferase
MNSEIAKKIASVPQWYHQITFPDGSVTPGTNESENTLAVYDSIGLPKQMDGMRVIDVGCSDGFYSFLCEKRGASEVVSLDYRLPTATGFSVASSILKSNARHTVDNVYNLSPDKFGQFDLIIFVGVMYHLRNPLLALDKIRSIAKKGATVLVETHIVNPELMKIFLEAGLSENSARKVLAQPLWQFYLRDALNHDATNKWAPTLGGLVQICEEAQLKPVSQMEFGSRGAVLCRAETDVSLESHRTMDTAVGINVS